MISWRSYIPAFSLALGLAAFAAAWFDFAHDDPNAAAVSLATADPAVGANTRPILSDPGQRRAATRAPRPTGLLELTFGRPEQILLVEQRRALLAHLARVRLTMSVPDAMSYASHRHGGAWVLTAASAPGAGFVLFSEKPARALKVTGVRKYLREFFKDTLALSFNAQDDAFLSRGAGPMTWIKGASVGGQRCDVFVFAPKKTGFTHVLFIYDPTVANASRRLMVDSLRAT